MFTGEQKDKTVIVGGYSPTLAFLPLDHLIENPVIGVNKFGYDYGDYCNYWLGCDTGLNWEKWAESTNPLYEKEPKFLKDLKIPKLMRTPNQDTEAFVPKDAGIFFDESKNCPLETTWQNKLQWQSSSAMAAVHFAIILGAKEIVLYGVDFIGNKRADNSRYPDFGDGKDFWSIHIEPMNGFLQKASQYASIYKVVEKSALEVPLWPKAKNLQSQLNLTLNL